MCDPITAIEDVALTAVGMPELIPLANAGTALAEGQGWGGAALAGGEALLGQEFAGAFGLGGGNTAFNDALGITWDNPAGLGLPDVGAGINNAIGSVENTLGFNASGTATPVAGEVTATGAPVDASGGTLTAAPTQNIGTFGSSGTSGANAFQIPDIAANQIGSTSASGIGDIGSTQGPTGFGSITAPQNFGAPATGSAAASSPSIGSIAAGTSPGTSGIGSSASAPSSPSFWNQAQSAAIKGALPLGMAAYEAIKGPAPLPTAAGPLQAGGAVTGPLIATETAGLNAYNSGTLTAPQQATIDQFVQDQQNQLIQQLASSGVTNLQSDSRYASGMSQIRQQAMVMQMQMLQQDFNNAFSSAGGAAANLGGVANQQIAQDKEFQDALSAALGAIGTSVSGGGIQLRAA